MKTYITLMTDSLCPHCKQGNLVSICGVFPYSLDHLQCEKCDSTYQCFQKIEEDNNNDAT